MTKLPPSVAPEPWSIDMDSVGNEWTDSLSISDGNRGHVCHLTRGYEGDSNGDDCPSWANARLIASAPDLLAALRGLVEAKTLSGVRGLVAGWNGEGKPGSPYPRHPSNLGATLPKTTCGAVYELDEALTRARAAIAKALG